MGRPGTFSADSGTAGGQEQSQDISGTGTTIPEHASNTEGVKMVKENVFSCKPILKNVSIRKQRENIGIMFTREALRKGSNSDGG